MGADLGAARDQPNRVAQTPVAEGYGNGVPGKIGAPILGSGAAP